MLQNRFFFFALVPRSGFGAAISHAIARSSIVFCNSVSGDRIVLAASRLLGAAAACVILLSFAAGHCTSYRTGCIKSAIVICQKKFSFFAACEFPIKIPLKSASKSVELCSDEMKIVDQEELSWHMTRHEMRWEELRWDELRWSASVKFGVRGVKSAVCSVKKVFAWSCIAPGSCAGHVLGQQQCNRFAQSTHARAWLAHGACKFYRWEKSCSITLRQLPPRLVRVLLVNIYNRRKFRSQTSDSMNRWKSRGGKESEKRRPEERRSEKRKSQKKEDAGVRKGRKVAKTLYFSNDLGLRRVEK